MESSASFFAPLIVCSTHLVLAISAQGEACFIVYYGH